MERTNNARRSWKCNNRIRRIVPAAVATVSAALATTNAGAASGTWTFNPAVTWNASWSTAVNWAGGIVADGAGNIADFSKLNITVNPTINLDTPRTIGQLSFND